MSDVPKLPINLVTLKELEKIAILDRVPGIENLEYVQAQQVLVINAVIKWMATYGLEAPFELKINE